MTTPARNAQYRRDLAELTAIAHNDLRILFRDITYGDQAREATFDVLPNLVAVYGSAAATLAADWYDDARDAAGARGRFQAIAAAPPAPNPQDMRWAVAPMYAAAPDPIAARDRVAGKAQLLIADAGRLTVTGSSIQDRRAQGWTRVGNDSCDWCAQYLNDVVYSDPGYGFQAHDWCQCSATPVFLD